MRAIFIFFFAFTYSLSFAQENSTVTPRFKGFNRSELSYTFGINESFNNSKFNGLHIKTVFGLALPQIGFGIGIENGTYRAATGSGGNFNTLIFSGNLHLLAKPQGTELLNYFVKASAGYGLRLGQNYSKGFNYDAALGGILTTGKGARYFLQAIYSHQQLEDFILANDKSVIKGVGIGIGTWF